MAKNTKNVFFACFWAFVGQPHSHIGWAKSMPFTSINSTNPMTSPYNFHKKILRIGNFKKHCFFELAIFELMSDSVNEFYYPMDRSMKFSQKNIENWQFWKMAFFLSRPSSSLWNLVSNYVLKWVGLNFYDYDGIQ